MEAIECGFIKSDAVFIDATHVKASANKNKYVKKMAEHRAHKYKRDLLIEINADREARGKKPFEDDDDDKKDGDSSSKDSVKEVKESTTDPESGMFHKGKKERYFAYTASVACDRNNFILGVKVAPGNVHDSQVFDLFQEVNEKFPEIEAVVVDAGYKTPCVCREIIEHYDCYLCPNNQVLKYSTTNRGGYWEYKSDPKICRECPMQMQCTQSKNYTKVVTRHVWEHYVEIAEDIRHTP